MFFEQLLRNVRGRSGGLQESAELDLCFLRVLDQVLVSDDQHTARVEQSPSVDHGTLVQQPALGEGKCIALTPRHAPLGQQDRPRVPDHEDELQILLCPRQQFPPSDVIRGLLTEDGPLGAERCHQRLEQCEEPESTFPSVDVLHDRLGVGVEVPTG